MSGFFLVLEGLDGSGKSEVSRRLAATMKVVLGDRVLWTYEPYNESAAGPFIRQVLAKDVQVQSRTLALAYALNRADHLDRVIYPFLSQATDAEPRLIICDRYYLSSLVYQSVDGMSRNNVMDLNASARTPDLTVFLDASAETCYERQGTRGKKRELFDLNLNETREKYLRAITYLSARGEQVVTVDANADLLTVINGVIEAINAYAPAWMHVEPLAELPPVAPTTNLRPAMEVFELHFLHKPAVQWE
ncbi:MAG: dTMP kinase [Anaerolineae bacterium]